MTTLDHIRRYQALANQIAHDRRACGYTVPVSAPTETAPVHMAELACLVLADVIPLLDTFDALSARWSGKRDIDAVVIRLQNAVSRAATATGLPACEFDDAE